LGLTIKQVHLIKKNRVIASLRATSGASVSDHQGEVVVGGHGGIAAYEYSTPSKR